MDAGTRESKEEAEGREELSEAEAWEVKQLKAAALEAAAGDGCSDIFELDIIAEEGAGEDDTEVRQCTDTKGGDKEEGLCGDGGAGVSTNEGELGVGEGGPAAVSGEVEAEGEE